MSSNNGAAGDAATVGGKKRTASSASSRLSAADPAGEKSQKRVKFSEKAGGEPVASAKRQPSVGSEDDDDGAEDLELGRKKRNKIKDGYTESDDEDDDGVDSDGEPDDGGGGEAGDSDDGQEKHAGAEDDMFGAAFESKDDQGPPGRKGTKMLSKDRIDKEGAEFEALNDADEEGEKIMPFNMDQELEEGGFDANFNYIREKDEHQMHDNWLQGVSKDDIQRAKAARDRQEARAKVLDSVKDGPQDENSIYLALLSHMKQRESVASAIKRNGSSKKVPAWKKNRKKAGDEETETAEETAEKVANLNALISLSDKLTSLGHYDVMEQTYESIVRLLRSKEVLPDEWQPGDAVPQSGDMSRSAEALEFWEYKWGPESADLFGPFPTAQMQAWRESGHFGPEVWVRKVTRSTSLDPQKGFSPITDVKFE
ncbi:hypothetical protein DFJ73DRAFT_799618 [Zopfochytrium polystomum]|nr:hypothetical protein DFJ73DRAFT_799618 [Zopfochytrium polystomum]